jgi:uncharacterized membrane protein
MGAAPVRARRYTLADLGPSYPGCVPGFVVISQHRLAYMHRVGTVRGADDGFAQLNATFLPIIAFVSFVTALVSRNHGRAATSPDAATMVVAWLLLVVMRLYAVRKGLVEPCEAPGRRWPELAASMQIAAIFGASVVVAAREARWTRLVRPLLAVPMLAQRTRKAVR